MERTRKALLTLAVALTGVLTASTLASASHKENGQDGSPRDFAVGTFFVGDQHGSFSAHGGPSPLEPVTGHFRAKGEVVDTGPPDKGPTAFKFEGPVTCLHVEGNRAGLIYPLKNADPEVFEGQAIMIFLEDGRDGNPDRVGFVGPAPIAGVTECPPGPTPFEVEKGDFKVHDAP